MLVSEHFDLGEFGSVPMGCVSSFEFLCQNILEPVRAFVGKPLRITSGYRSSAENAAAHGVPDSEHIATPTKCAADFTFDTTFGLQISFRACFDWIRKNPLLPFHQCILEHTQAGGSIIHISWNKNTLPERQALEGQAYNAFPYTSWECADYELPDSTGLENV